MAIPRDREEQLSVLVDECQKLFNEEYKGIEKDIEC
jgi:hypothetical protein